MYAAGQGVPQDYARALKWSRKAAEQSYGVATSGFLWARGHPSAYAKLGTALIQWVRTTAEAGEAEAQNLLGLLYDEGPGVPWDHVEALNWYRKAAEQGNSDAQHNLGVMYTIGRGVERDDAEAGRWFRMAAEQGDADAQFMLAMRSPDAAESVKMLHRAAEAGSASVAIPTLVSLG